MSERNEHCRTATMHDVKQMMKIRLAVKENRLSDPSMITEKEYEEFMRMQGRGWVFETFGEIAGFAFVDLSNSSIWALFVHPDQEGKGIGKKLLSEMLDWYFSHLEKTLWLTTAAETRAEHFYKAAGWIETARQWKYPKNPALPPYVELRLEHRKNAWKENR